MNPIDQLNKIFDSRIRLGIMSSLLVNEKMNFNELKELIAVTDGNLASHLKTLEDSGYIKVQKGFIGRKTNTSYSVTKAGEKAFKQHLDALDRVEEVKNWKSGKPFRTRTRRGCICSSAGARGCSRT